LIPEDFAGQLFFFVSVTGFYPIVEVFLKKSGGIGSFPDGFLCFPVNASVTSRYLRHDLRDFAKIPQDFVKNLSTFLFHPAIEMIYPGIQRFILRANHFSRYANDASCDGNDFYSTFFISQSV
jgi:hypothetical protein